MMSVLKGLVRADNQNVYTLYSYEEYITVSKVHYFAAGAFFRGCLSISERCRRKRAGFGGVNRRRKINDRGGEAKLNCIRA